MLLRALFWISLVALLMPREPNLGFGRPGDHGLTSEAVSLASAAVAQPSQLCNGHEASCAAGLSVLQSLQSVALRGLARVKADIEAEQHARSHAG